MIEPSAEECAIRARAKALFDRLTPVVDRALDEWLPRESEVPEAIHRSMRYSVLAPGKRLRPVLALLTGEALALSHEQVLPIACALEVVHAFSLIHDDLPAMDDDDLRRGRPTNHKVFGEAIAILAGDALACFAFELLAEKTRPESAVGPLVAELARALGTRGMIGGQVLDMQGEELPPDLALVQDIHRKKTAALLAASTAMPAILGQLSAARVSGFRTFGEQIGLAFQIVDDLLDRHATPEAMGKATGKDAARGKQTWPTAAGTAAAEAAVLRLTSEANTLIAPEDARGDLRALADFLTLRRT